MKHPEKRIAAVIVTYNRLSLLKKCLVALLEQSFGDFDLLIIDNASTDETGSYCRSLAEENHRILYHNTGSNLGGAGGFSYGIRTGIEQGYDYLWLMDDDTIPSNTALEMLLQNAALLGDDFGFLSSYAVWTDGKPAMMNIPGVSITWREEVDRLFENKLFRIDTASFVSLLLRADVVRDLGLPIKEFFIWADDVEYTWRISRHYPCYFCYDSKVVHEMRTNIGTTILDEPGERLERYLYLFRNRYYIARATSRRARINYAIDIKNTVRDLLKTDLPDKYRRVRIVLTSYLSGRRFRPQIEYVNKSENSLSHSDRS